MEKTLKLRKPSIKSLIVLLEVSEKMLFSFPVPADLRMKYERMRSEIFKELRIKNHGLPLPTETFEDRPGKDPLNKVFLLETFNCLQQTFLTLENFEEELRFKTVTMKNFYNTLNAFGTKLMLKPGVERVAEEVDKECDFELMLERYKQKVHDKNRSLSEIKDESAKIEEKVMKSIQVTKEKQESQLEQDFKSLQHQYTSLQESNNHLTTSIETLKHHHSLELHSLKSQLSSITHELNSLKSEEPTTKPLPPSPDLLILKQKLSDLELSNQKLSQQQKHLEDQVLHLSSLNSTLKSKSEKHKQKSLQLKSVNSDLEKVLEYERNSFDFKLKSLQQELFSHSSDLKTLQTEHLHHIESIHKQELLKLQDKHEAEIRKYKEEVQAYKNQQATSEENNKKIIKSLQFEVLKSKETIVKQYEDLTNDRDLKKTQEIVEKLENKVVETEGVLKHLAEVIFPVYESYQAQQQDWNEDEVLRNFAGFEEYGKILVSAEFLVFFLEKNLRDKNWLLNKLEQMHADARLTKTNSVGTLASPGNFRDRGMYRDIWQSIKESSVVMQNFEKCRENLVSQFVSK